MSRAKAMGTAVESAAVSWLRVNGFPAAERLALAGAADRGDIRLQPDPVIIAECKRAQRGVQLTPWMREVQVEASNASAAYGLLIAKQRGAGGKSVGRWFAAMHYQLFLDMINESRFNGIPDIQEWSPMRINSDYVPMLTNRDYRSRAFPGGWVTLPFASTYTPGEREQRIVCGPLEQFTVALLTSGYGKEQK